jgi:hypothetical protein
MNFFIKIFKIVQNVFKKYIFLSKIYHNNVLSLPTTIEIQLASKPILVNK